MREALGDKAEVYCSTCWTSCTGRGLLSSGQIKLPLLEDCFFFFSGARLSISRDGKTPPPKPTQIKTVSVNTFQSCLQLSDSVKRHLRGRHLSVLDLKFDFISDGGCTREEQIALSLKRRLFPHGGREPKVFWICFSTLPPIFNVFSNF